jgi:hypothetical protein
MDERQKEYGVTYKEDEVEKARRYKIFKVSRKVCGRG